jgi:drug/metabolite transporter (DMT)-like permease
VPATPDPSLRSRQEAWTWATFLSLAAIWGSSYLFIKIGLEDGLPPYTLVSLRTLFGALCLGLLMVATRGRLPRTRRAWSRISLLAVVNIAIPFALTTWGSQSISSGLVGILNAMQPLFAVVLASLVLHDEPLTGGRVAGLLLGFAGIVTLALPRLTPGNSSETAALLGMAAVVGASLAYAVGAVYARHRITGRPLIRGEDGVPRAPTALEISFAQVLVAAFVTTTISAIVERPPSGILTLPSSAEGWFAILWLGVLGTGLAYILYFRVMAAWGATRTTLVTYVMPVIAIVLGFVFLGERLRPAELVGTALIIGGVVLVNLPIDERLPWRRTAR